MPSDETRLDIVLTAAAGPVTEVRYRPIEGSETVRGCDGVGYEIPVSAAVMTADGILGESVQTLLGVGSPRTAILAFSLDLDQLAGTLELVSDEFSLDGGLLRVTAWLFEGGSQGRIEPMIEAHRTGGIPPTASNDAPPAPTSSAQDDDPNAHFEPVRYIATWPAARICQGGMPPLHPQAAVIGSSPLDVLAIVEQLGRALEAVALPVVLSFEPLPQELCTYVGYGLAFAGYARISVPSAGIDARLPLQVRASLDLRGDLTRIDIARVDQENALTRDELASKLGSSVEGTDQFDRLYLFIQEQLTLDSEAWTGRGEILVHGYTETPCSGGVGADEDAGAATRSATCGPPSFTLDVDGRLVPPGSQLLNVRWSTD